MTVGPTYFTYSSLAKLCTGIAYFSSISMIRKINGEECRKC